MIKIKEKGWFRGLGLHHGAGAVVWITTVHFLDFNPLMVFFVAVWYASREEKEYELRRQGLYGVEWLDFLVPWIVAGIYYAIYK